MMRSKGTYKLNNRRIFRLLIATMLAVLGLLLVALAPSTAQAQTPTPEPGPTINVSPNSGIVGQRIKVTGYRFALSTSLSVLFNDVQVGNGFTTDTGTLYASFTVPTRPKGL